MYSCIAVSYTHLAYTQIATIATDDHHTLQEFRASVGAQWTFLSDPDRTVQKDLDIQEYTDPEHNPMIPHTLVLKPGLVIYSVYNGYWFWGRPSAVSYTHLDVYKRQVDTPMHQNDPKESTSQPAVKKAAVKDIVDAVLYLVQADHVSGEILHVDGAAPARRW